MVAIGATLPKAAGAYSVTELLAALATKRSPAASCVTPSGWLSPVLAPEIVAIGVALPDACAAYSVTELTNAFVTHMRGATAAGVVKA